MTGEDKYKNTAMSDAYKRIETLKISIVRNLLIAVAREFHRVECDENCKECLISKDVCNMLGDMRVEEPKYA